MDDKQIDREQNAVTQPSVGGEAQAVPLEEDSAGRGHDSQQSRRGGRPWEGAASAPFGPPPGQRQGPGGCLLAGALLAGGWALVIVPGGVYRWLQIILTDRSMRMRLLVTALVVALFWGFAVYPRLIPAAAAGFVDVSDIDYVGWYGSRLLTADVVLTVCGALVFLVRPDWAGRLMRAVGITAMTLIYSFYYQIGVVVSVLREVAK